MLIGSYSSALVLISIFVAILASYTALDLTGALPPPPAVPLIYG